MIIFLAHVDVDHLCRDRCQVTKGPRSGPGHSCRVQGALGRPRAAVRGLGRYGDVLDDPPVINVLIGVGMASIVGSAVLAML